MKSIYNIYETSILDIEDTLKPDNVNIDARCRLNWRMTHYNTKNFKMVPGGRKTIVEKYFGKKIEPAYASTHVSFSKNFNLAEKNKALYTTPTLWFEAIILNAKFDIPIDDVLKNRTYAPYKPIDDRLEYEFNSRLLPEYKSIYENGDPIIRTFTKWVHRSYRTEIVVTIFLTSAVLKADMKNNYGKLCEITFLYNEDNKKSV